MPSIRMEALKGDEIIVAEALQAEWDACREAMGPEYRNAPVTARSTEVWRRVQEQTDRHSLDGYEAFLDVLDTVFENCEGGVPGWPIILRRVFV